MINRGFVSIEEGLVHYRCKLVESEHLPLLCVHAGPVSSASLMPLLSGFTSDRTLYAPDTLGFGDSAQPAGDAPDIAYFADSLIRVMDSLGLEKVDFYGSHTGANIGCELAIAYPGRIRKLVFEGIGLFDKATREDLLQNYAPQKAPDEYGGHLQWAWQFLRDQSLYYPYYKRDAEHRLEGSVFPTDLMHDFVIDILKALNTYHKGYNAVFNHDPMTRLPLIKHEILFMAHQYDPMKIYVEDAVRISQRAKGIRFSGDDDVFDQAKSIEKYLI